MLCLEKNKLITLNIYITWQDAEDEADDSDLSPFEALRRKMTSLTSDGGVRKQVLQQGVGDVVSNLMVHLNLVLCREKKYNVNAKRRCIWNPFVIRQKYDISKEM